MSTIQKTTFTTLCFLGIVLNPGVLKAQTIETLDLTSCYELAQANYPLIKEYALLEKTRAYSLENVSKGNLPILQIGGQASYQSDVTQLPILLPGANMPTMDKDQYKIYLDASQPITDLLTTVKHQRELVNAESMMKAKYLDAEMYKIKGRVNNLFFGILLVIEQIQQAEILKKNIQSGIDRNKVAVENGIVLKSSVDVLRAELLKVDKRIIQLEANHKAYMGMLALFIGQTITENAVLVRPAEITLRTEINRPELAVFEAQKEILQTQEKLINDKTLPRLSLFGQSGYGRPGLNMLSNDFDLYYIAGFRASWNLTSFYTRKNEKEKLDLQRESVKTEEETFLFNTRLAIQEQVNEIAKLETLIEVDRTIIQLRENVRLSAQSQLENGTITVNDYLSYVNDEDEANQELILQQIKRLIVQYEHRNTTGN